MRLSVFTIIALAGLAVSSSHVLAEPPGSPEASASENDLDRVVCKKGKAPTGTRFPGPRECHTQRQWDEIQRQSREELTRVQNQGLQSGRPGGG